MTTLPCPDLLTLRPEPAAPASPLVSLALALAGPQARAPGLSCTACRDALPEYIEAELNNQLGPSERMVRRHLDRCNDCTDLYLHLLVIALETEAGPLLHPALPLDLSFLDACQGMECA